MADCHREVPSARPTAALSTGTGTPRPALVLGGALGLVALAAIAVVALIPFQTAAFGGLWGRDDEGN